MGNRKQLIAVVGPTGSGKTALGVHIAKRYNGVIISADSRQVYKRMDIGTNKEGTPGTWQGQTDRTVDGVAQLLIDVAEPGNRFTLADWLERAQKSLEIIWAQGQLPVLVGGTGLYVSALLDGYRLGAGRFAKERVPVDFSCLVLMSEASRELLYQRSDERVERIFDQVSLEVSSLLESGVEKTWLERIGLDYSFALKFQTGALSRDEAIQQCQQASRQYIRRQITWWRHHQNPQLVRSAAAAVEQVAQFLKAPEKAVE